MDREKPDEVGGDRAADDRTTVLLIDDEQPLRRALCRLLARNYRLLEAGSGAEALDLAEEHPEIDIVLCDLIMPEMDGATLFEQLSARRPDLAERTIFMTGGTVTERARELARIRSDRLVRKPFDLDELHQLIDRLLRAE